MIRWTTPVSRKRITYDTERRDNKVTKGDCVDNELGRVRAVPRLCELYPGICLTTEGKSTLKPQSANIKLNQKSSNSFRHELRTQKATALHNALILFFNSCKQHITSQETYTQCKNCYTFAPRSLTALKSLSDLRRSVTDVNCALHSYNNICLSHFHSEDVDLLWVWWRVVRWTVPDISQAMTSFPTHETSHPTTQHHTLAEPNLTLWHRYYFF